jgi:hydroxymethylbilane synthase
VQLRALFPQATFASVRGNLQTRLRKLDEGGYGALVLAAAGLKRMGLADRIGRYLSADEVIPSAGQGVLAVQGRVDADPSLFEGFADEDVATAVLAERAFVARLDGGCSSPIAAHARLDGDTVSLYGLYYDEGQQQARRGFVQGARADAIAMANSLADTLRAGQGDVL